MKFAPKGDSVDADAPLAPPEESPNFLTFEGGEIFRGKWAMPTFSFSRSPKSFKVRTRTKVAYSSVVAMIIANPVFKV